MRSRLCISRNFLTVSAVLKYVWNRVKPACSPAAGHRKPRKLLPSHLHGITAISLKQPPPSRLSFSASQFRHVYLVSPPPTRFTRVQSKYTVFHYATSRRDTSSSNAETRCPEICQSHALFSIAMDRDFESRISSRVFRCLIKENKRSKERS